MHEWVNGYGASTAKLIVVGEAPGEDEERIGKPFVGATGQIVRDLVRKAGLHPESEVYYTNVCKVRPPGNDIKALHVLGKSLEDFMPVLWQELDAMRPNCVLAVGNTALNALTGHDGIQKYRGSILQARNGQKVVGTIHPASLMHAEATGMSSWKDLVFIQWDFDRAVKQARFKELELPHRNLMICKSVRQLDQFLHDHRRSEFASLDIETFKTFPICLAIAFNESESLSIPLFEIINAVDRPFIWRLIAEFLEGPTKKIGQNFKFDQQMMERCDDLRTHFGFKINNFYFDTMLGFRTLYPELPAKLEFIASVLTEEPYWKDEGKEFNPKRDSLDRLLLYNAKDAAVTFECFEREIEEMRQLGIDDFFFERVMPLHDFYRKMERRGIRRDEKAVHILRAKYEAQRDTLEIELQMLINSFGLDEQVVGKKGVKMYNSPKQVERLMFIGLKLPPRKNVNDDSLSALARNAVKDLSKKRIIDLILDLRKVHKTIGTYINAKSMPDGRLRTSVRIALETGRTATNVLKPPVTTEKYGMAFQTITKHGEIGSDLRSQFIADEGYVLVEPDLSQAESRVIAILSNDPRQQKIFDFGVDIHRLTASWIFERPIPEMMDFFQETDEVRLREIALIVNQKLKKVILPDERQLGKTFRHAGEGGMEKHRASQLTNLSEWRAGKLLELFHRNSPNIREVYYKEIQACLRDNDRVLVNPFGRRRQFMNKGEEMLKEAYRQLPQSTVSDQVKFAMLRIEREEPAIEFLEESHDSFLCQIPNDPDTLERCGEVIKRQLETPIDFSRCSLPRGLLTIPCEIKKGNNWERMK